MDLFYVYMFAIADLVTDLLPDHIKHCLLLDACTIRAIVVVHRSNFTDENVYRHSSWHTCRQ